MHDRFVKRWADNVIKWCSQGPEGKERAAGAMNLRLDTEQKKQVTYAIHKKVGTTPDG